MSHWSKHKRRGQLLTVGVLVAAVVAVAAAMFVVVDARTTGIEETVYQYFNDRRFDYGKDTSLIAGEDEVLLQTDGKKVPTDTSPIYFDDRAALILPRTMSWFSPYTGDELRCDFFAEISNAPDTGSFAWKIGKKTGALPNGFLFDGQDTYVFLEDMIVSWDGEEHKAASLSFITAAADGAVRLYDYGTKTLLCETPQIGVIRASTASGSYTIHISNDAVTMANGSDRLLFIVPNGLDPLQ